MHWTVRSPLRLAAQLANCSRLMRRQLRMIRYWALSLSSIQYTWGRQMNVVSGCRRWTNNGICFCARQYSHGDSSSFWHFESSSSSVAWTTMVQSATNQPPPQWMIGSKFMNTVQVNLKLQQISMNGRQPGLSRSTGSSPPTCKNILVNGFVSICWRWHSRHVA